MMKNMLLLAFLIFSFKAFAQFDDTVQSVNLERIARLEAGLHGIGVGLELPFSEKWSVSLSTGLGGGYAVYAEHFQSTFIINQPVAFFKTEFKYTYNRSKRLSKSKSLLNTQVTTLPSRPSTRPEEYSAAIPGMNTTTH